MDGAGVMLDVLSAYLPFSFVSYMHEFHLLHSHSLFFSPSFRCALGYVFFLPIFFNRYLFTLPLRTTTNRLGICGRHFMTMRYRTWFPEEWNNNGRRQTPPPYRFRSSTSPAPLIKDWVMKCLIPLPFVYLCASLTRYCASNPIHQGQGKCTLCRHR